MIHVYDMASGERLDEKPENQDQVTAQEYALVVAPRLAEYFEEEPVTAEQSMPADLAQVSVDTWMTRMDR